MTILSEIKIFLLLLVVFFGVAKTDNDSRNFPESTLESSELRSDDLQKIGEALATSDGERVAPFKNVVMGIYQNYRSTYLGNRTTLEYVKNGSRKSMMSKDTVASTSKPGKVKKRKKRKKKKKSVKLPVNYDGTLRYTVGPGVNISLDMEREIVNLNLGEDYMKDILTGNWDGGNDESRKKKDKGMFAKIMPLFILPFLIQSAIIPFLVTKLKLLLVKSIIIGKLAIFLLVISAIKNSQKPISYEALPAYYADPPSRRSEAISGYRVEGRPATWIN